MRTSYLFEIITPAGQAYGAEVSHVLVPAEDGFTGVLAHHAPFVTSSNGGRLEVRERGGETKKFRVGSGFFEVRGNRGVFLTQSVSEIS